MDRRGHTLAMGGRPGPGALIGLVVGVVLVGVVLWLPAALAGDFYEFSDPLIFMGLPIITISAAVGALIGVPVEPVSGDGPAGQARRPSWARKNCRSGRGRGCGARCVVVPSNGYGIDLTPARSGPAAGTPRHRPHLLDVRNCRESEAWIGGAETQVWGSRRDEGARGDMPIRVGVSPVPRRPVTATGRQ